MKHLTKAIIIALPVVALAACAQEPTPQTASVTTVQPVAQPAPMATYETERMYQRELRK